MPFLEGSANFFGLEYLLDQQLLYADPPPEIGEVDPESMEGFLGTIYDVKKPNTTWFERRLFGNYTSGLFGSYSGANLFNSTPVIIRDIIRCHLNPTSFYIEKSRFWGKPEVKEGLGNKDTQTFRMETLNYSFLDFQNDILHKLEPRQIAHFHNNNLFLVTQMVWGKLASSNFISTQSNGKPVVIAFGGIQFCPGGKYKRIGYTRYAHSSFGNRGEYTFPFKNSNVTQT